MFNMPTISPSDKPNSYPPETALICIKNPANREKHNCILPLAHAVFYFSPITTKNP